MQRIMNVLTRISDWIHLIHITPAVTCRTWMDFSMTQVHVAHASNHKVPGVLSFAKIMLVLFCFNMSILTDTFNLIYRQCTTHRIKLITIYTTVTFSVSLSTTVISKFKKRPVSRFPRQLYIPDDKITRVLHQCIIRNSCYVSSILFN